MVNNNGIPIEVNKKPFETVQELKDEYKVPSFEEFMETYEADEKVINSYRDEVEYVNGWAPKGSGPCKKSYCKCSCDKDICNCQWDVEDWIGKSGCERYGFLRTSGKGKVRWREDGKLKNGVLDADGSFSAVATKNGSEEARFFGLSGGISAACSEEDGIRLKGKLGIDAYNYKDENKEVRLGLNVDTGVKFGSDNMEVKALGFGISANNEQIGVSTPLFEAKCVVQ